MACISELFPLLFEPHSIASLFIFSGDAVEIDLKLFISILVIIKVMSLVISGSVQCLKEIFYWQEIFCWRVKKLRS